MKCRVVFRKTGAVLMNAVAVLALPSIGSSEQFAYVGNHFSQTVSVIDLTTDTVVAPPISVGSVPFGTAVRPGGAEVWVANHDDATVSVIQTSTRTEIHRFSIDGNVARWIAFAPDGTTAYVTDPNSNRIRVVDTTTKTLRLDDTVQLAVDRLPIGIAVTPNGTRAYVSSQTPGNSTLGKVIVIDAATNQVASEIEVGFSPVGILVSPDGRYVYVTNSDQDTVSVIATGTDSVFCTFAVGDFPQGLAVSRSGHRLYVANYFSSVSVIDTSALSARSASCPSEVHQIAMPGQGAHYLAVTPDDRRLYVALHDADLVAIVDTDTNAIVGPGIAVAAPMVIEMVVGPPASKENCKKGGWKTFNIPRTFNNQGDCVSFVETGH
jgi:YVTN family beta-propeller protein